MLNMNMKNNLRTKICKNFDFMKCVGKNLVYMPTAYRKYWYRLNSGD